MCKILLILLLLISSNLSGGWLSRKAEGWAWYEDREKKKKKEQADVESSEPQTLEAVRQQIDQKLERAILEPSEENVIEFMKEQRHWINRSAYFADVWSRILINHPEFDPTAAGVPVSQYGLQIYKQQRKERQDEHIKQLAREQGLFFFYEGEKKESQVFSFLVHELERLYGWRTIAVSMDGILISGFAHNKEDNGIAGEMGVVACPALFIVDPKTKEATPISFGLNSLDQIERNIALQFGFQEKIAEDNL